jgi:hypothetical protein
MTAIPARLQLARAKGFDLKRVSAETNGLAVVVVTRPGRWGNPWAVGKVRTAAEAVAKYRAALLGGELAYTVDDVREMLRGKNLACWCKLGAPCHGDVLLQLANASQR